MTIPLLKQFVPSEVCLKCDGCCRFKEDQSDWRPRMTPDEVKEAGHQGLADEIFAQQVIDPDHSVQTALQCGQHTCRFLNTGDNTCRVYAARPFECQLYPFVVTHHGPGVSVAMHLACPYIQEKLNTDDLRAYTEYLQKFFGRTQVRFLLNHNRFLIRDYGRYREELEFLFTVRQPLAIDIATDLLQHRDEIERALAAEPRNLSTYAFVQIFAWKDFFDFELKTIGGCLCIFAHHPLGCFLYLPPLGGTATPAVIEECFRHMQDINGKGGVARIENVTEAQRGLFDPNDYIVAHKSDEYCYFRDHIVGLTGNIFKSKRSSYNQFVKNRAYTYVPYRAELRAECLALYRSWAADRARKYPGDAFRAMLEDNFRVHELILGHYEALGLTGRVVLVDGAVKAYTFGYPLSGETFCVFLEVADLTVRGLPVFIFREFCADDALKKFKFINAMDDFGMDNIKHVKRSFHPSLLIPSYTVVRKE